MGFFNRFIPGPGAGWPYTNLHEINLNWILGVVKKFEDEYEHIQELIQNTTDEGLEELENKKTQIENLLNAWYQTHSSDIANELLSAISEIETYAQGIISTIPLDYSTLSYKTQDFINFSSFNIITTESGTFSDSDGATKTSNAARRRNRSPIPVEEIAYLKIPAGYEIYTYCLDGYYSKFDTISWTNTELNAKNIPFGTKYINFALRKIADPTDDISTNSINLKVIKIGHHIVPRWNIDEQGIYIDGNAIVIDGNGFSLLYNNNFYTIGPVDTTSITRFTANAGDVKTLVINTEKLATGGRCEPSETLELLSDIPYQISNDKYIPIAQYYKNYWDYVTPFNYFSQEGKRTPEPDYVSWNNKAGGIAKDNNDIVVNSNGFCMTFNGHTYYIAPRDMTSVTTFTPTLLNGTYCLVIDPVTLKYPGERNNPSDVMSIIDFRGSAYTKRYITVAVYYKGVWHFSGKFAYFETGKAVPVNDIFNTQRLIAHKGGNTDTENTIANFEDAIENGYTFVEADAQITSDNVIVLHHDTTFTIGGQSYTFSNLTYTQVVNLIPNIATLSELLTLCKKHNIVVDLDCSKGSSINYIKTIYNTVKKCGCLSRVMFTVSVQNAKQLINNSRCIICLTEIDTEEELNNVIDIINNSALCVCSVQYANYTASVAQLMHDYGCLCKVWTVNNADNINTVFNNAEFVITDSIKESDL